MIRFRIHVPLFVLLGPPPFNEPPEVQEVADQKELLSHPFFSFFAREPYFKRFMLSTLADEHGAYLMWERDDGAHYVLAYISQGADQLTLPEWKPKDYDNR